MLNCQEHLRWSLLILPPIPTLNLKKNGFLWRTLRIEQNVEESSPQCLTSALLSPVRPAFKCLLVGQLDPGFHAQCLLGVVNAV